MAYSPLEQGLLTGKVGMDTVFPPEYFRNKLSWFAPERRRRVLNLLAGWQPLTEKYGCTVAQLVIAWTVAQPGIAIALCGARKTANAIENAGAGAVTIEPDDLARMRREVEALAPLNPCLTRMEG